MQLKKELAVAVLSVSFISGCASTSGNTAAGAGVGAAIGAGLGALFGKSSSSVAIGAGIGAIAGGILGYNWDDIAGKVDKAGEKIGVETTKMPDGSLKVNIPAGTSFDKTSSQLKPGAYPVLDTLAKEMERVPKLRLKVVGHTDNKEAVKYNQALSSKRAHSVVNYIHDKGVASSRMSTEGRGAYDPIADNSSEQGRAKNRRVEVYLYAES